MEKKEVKKLIELDAARSKAATRGETKEYIQSIAAIKNLIRASGTIKTL